MEESEAIPTSKSTEDEEEQLISDNTFTEYSADKQKVVLMKYIQVYGCGVVIFVVNALNMQAIKRKLSVQEKTKLKEELESKEKLIQEYKAKVYDLTNSLSTTEKDLAQAKKEKNHSLRAPPLV